MDRYVRREPRILNYQQGNQVNFEEGINVRSADDLFYGLPLSAMISSLGAPQNVQRVPNSSYSNAAQVNSSCFISDFPSGQVKIVSGIDPRYLAAYDDANANFIATGQHIQRERCTITANPPFGDDYQNRDVAPPERNMAKMFSPKGQQMQIERCTNPPFGDNYQNHNVALPPGRNETNMPQMFPPKPSASKESLLQADNFPKEKQPTNRGYAQVQRVVQQSVPHVAVPKITENTDVQKSIQNQIMTRSDKLKALYRSGTRVFSGPVEKVLKWHKALQDIGVLVLYEIVAKCVNVRPGESCAKNLVVRDENGPAMQVVYYEVDFLLPELKPPCTIRVIGKMMAGSCRFQAFNVRSATGDDVATLPRRAAVAAHHVAKLCKEYGADV